MLNIYHKQRAQGRAVGDREGDKIIKIKIIIIILTCAKMIRASRTSFYSSRDPTGCCKIESTERDYCRAVRRP